MFASVMLRSYRKLSPRTHKPFHLGRWATFGALLGLGWQDNRRLSCRTAVNSRSGIYAREYAITVSRLSDQPGQARRGLAQAIGTGVKQRHRPCLKE